MDYKYHHTVLELFYKNKLDSSNSKSDREVKVTNNNLYFYPKELATKLGIKEDKSLSILTNLRVEGCLQSAFDSDKSEISFWLLNDGITKYHEQYFKYKRKEQCANRRIQILKFTFYIISTLGIMLSQIF